jgi:hypothetical protein
MTIVYLPASLSERGITIETGQRVRTWSGWYRHDTVRRHGVVIGRVQTKRANKRTEVITLALDPGGSCVIGCDIEWLERLAQEPWRTPSA